MEHVNKIADFLTGRLSPQEMEEVRLQIEANSEWSKELTFQKELVFCTIEVKKRQLRKRFNEIEAKLQAKEATKSLSTSIHQIKTFIHGQIDYTLEQLQTLFAPVPHYQPLLAMTKRAGEIEVLTPKSGVDCGKEGLYFELSEESEENLELSIENNQCEELYSQEIPFHTQQFYVPFAAKDYPPGRYYWKLMMEDEMVLGEFFVNKDMLSEE